MDITDNVVDEFDNFADKCVEDEAVKLVIDIVIKQNMEAFRELDGLNGI